MAYAALAPASHITTSPAVCAVPAPAGAPAECAEFITWAPAPAAYAAPAPFVGYCVPATTVYSEPAPVGDERAGRAVSSGTGAWRSTLVGRGAMLVESTRTVAILTTAGRRGTVIVALVWPLGTQTPAGVTVATFCRREPDLCYESSDGRPARRMGGMRSWRIPIRTRTGSVTQRGAEAALGGASGTVVPLPWALRMLSGPGEV